MKLSYDRKIVTFKCESEELFSAEKSGRKCNTVRILDASEYYPLTGTFFQQIIIQYNHEVFMRQITDFRVVGEVLGKYVVIFSWQHKEAEETEDGS